MTVPRTLRFAAAVAVVLLLPGATGGRRDVRAADALTYEVTITPTGIDRLDQAVSDSAALVKLRVATGDQAFPLGGLALMARARADAARFADMMGSLGYYDGQVDIGIAGHLLDDPALPDVLDSWPDAETVPVTVKLSPGVPFHLRRIVLQGDAAGQGIDLHPGDLAVASLVLAAAAKLRADLEADGHALARVEAPVADLDKAAHALDLTIGVAAGPRVSIGRVTIIGLERLHEDFVRRRLDVQPGEPFDPAVLEADRVRLSRVPAIASVRLDPGTALDPDGTLPLRVLVSERKLRIVSISAGYSTDQGGEAAVGWTHRNLFGGAETLALTAGVTNLFGTNAMQPGYRTEAQLTIPDWPQRFLFARNQTLGVNALALREYLDAYDRTAAVLGTSLAFGITSQITGVAGLTVEKAYIVQNQVGRSYSLVQLPLTLRLDTTNDPLEPVTGIRATVNVTPTQSFSRSNANFVIAQAQASTYFDLAEPGRTVLAMRGLLGVVQGATTFEIPPDQRFYAGGSGSVRGYRFQSIGPVFHNNKPIGGTNIAAATVELRQRFGETWGAAVFVDVGGVGTNGVPLAGQLRVGAGMGARYYTSFGAIRLDVAAPLQRPKGGDIGELYIGLGQAF